MAREAGLDPNSFVQHSLSRSRRGVLRGLHMRTGRSESRLVRCSSRVVFEWSSTYVMPSTVPIGPPAAVAAKWDTRSQRGASGGGASCDAASELPERRLRGKCSIRPGRRRRLL